MRTRSLGAVVVLLAAGTGARTVPDLPQDMHQWALASIDLVYRQDFAGAEEQASRIVHHYADHPAGYFFRAASLDAWMALNQSTSRENDFYRDCNLAVEKAELLADRGEDNAWTQFFMGGAEGLKGSYEMRYGRWITAFRYGWKGVTVLRRLRRDAKDMRDIDYGIGSYMYWRSAMARILKWLPEVADEREKGIALLWSARRQGVYTRMASATMLLEAMFNESRYDTMLTLSEELLRSYPRSLLFQNGKARALYGLGRYEEAERLFQIVLSGFESAGLESRFQTATARYWLARTYYQMGRYASCIAECEAMRRLAQGEDLSRRMAETLAEAMELQQAATRQRAGAPPGGQDSARHGRGRAADGAGGCEDKGRP